MRKKLEVCRNCTKRRMSPPRFSIPHAKALCYLPRRKEGYSMQPDIIGAGVGRTGTLSLKAALETLGKGPCHHMEELRKLPRQLDEWEKIAEGAQINWDSVLDGYCATVDWPAAAFWQELTNAFPTAKVILTWRDPDEWQDSFDRTIGYKVRNYHDIVDTKERRIARIARHVVTKTLGLDPVETPDLRGALHNHHTVVTSNIPSERLLVYHASEGWNPLCGFLGLPVPEEEFPKLNARNQFVTGMK